jgi:hypothetical protein
VVLLVSLARPISSTLTQTLFNSPDKLFTGTRNLTLSPYIQLLEQFPTKIELFVKQKLLLKQLSELSSPF